MHRKNIMKLLRIFQYKDSTLRLVVASLVIPQPLLLLVILNFFSYYLSEYCFSIKNISYIDHYKTNVLGCQLIYTRYITFLYCLRLYQTFILYNPDFFNTLRYNYRLQVGTSIESMLIYLFNTFWYYNTI
jgi:hypothetical protein